MSYIIEKGISIPPRRRVNDPWLNDFSIGDSIVIDLPARELKKEVRRIRSAALNRSMNVAQRTVGFNLVRIWRVA
jgi:hypothetical protein